MEIEKAIKQLDPCKSCKSFGLRCSCSSKTAYNELLIEAEELIPKKPFESEYSPSRCCGKCGELLLTMKHESPYEQYCLNCGQKIDWNV